MNLSTARQKGFTLIELLVVIAILGVLVVGLMVAIDPAEKIRQASDSRVVNDFGAVSRAAEAYSTSNAGSYPDFTSWALFTADLIGTGDLKVAPSAPNGYTAYAVVADGTNTGQYVLVGELQANKYGTCTGATPEKIIRYTSNNGVTCYGCVDVVTNVDEATPVTCTPLPN